MVDMGKALNKLLYAEIDSILEGRAPVSVLLVHTDAWSWYETINHGQGLHVGHVFIIVRHSSLYLMLCTYSSSYSYFIHSDLGQRN